MKCYNFLNKQLLSSKDLEVLNILYLPILKLDALGLYHILCSLSLEFNSINDTDLYKNLGVSSNKFLKLKEKLEALGLLKTYSDSSDLLFLLNPPLLISDFFKKSVLHSLFKSSVSTDYYNNVVNSLDNVDISKYKDVSASFDSVYSLVNIEMYKNDLPFSLNNLVFKNSNFDLNLFISKLPKNFKLSNKEMYLISNVADLFSFTEDTIFKLFTLSFKDNYFDLSLFHKLSEEEFFTSNKEVVLKEVSNDLEDIVLEFSHITPSMLLATIKQNPTKDDIRSLSGVLDKFSKSNMNPTIFNILLLIAINKTKSVPAFEYILKMYNSFKERGLYSVYDYARFLLDSKDSSSKQKKTYKNKSNVTPPIWQVEAWDEISRKTESGEIYSDIDAYLGDYNEEA